MLTLEERFWGKVDQQAIGCWLWTGWTTHDGYGRVWHQGRHMSAHRVSYEIAHGFIPDGLELDHLCRVRHCVNPSHLEPVSHKTNILRGTGFLAINARKTHCPQGHAYTLDNLEKQANRKCSECRRQRQRLAYEGRKDA